MEPSTGSAGRAPFATRVGCALAVTLWAGSVRAAAAAADGAVTFNRDIAPIVYANCSTCHREGEAAPFALLSYRDVKKHAGQIADLTSRRVMPPWKADPSEHGGFVGERRLTDAQIATLRRWVDAGAPEGAGPSPAAPTFPVGWQQGEPDLVVTMPEAFHVPADGPDIYRCFPISVEPPEGKYLRSVEYRPGDRRVVHHAVMTTMSPSEATKKLLEDGDETGPGFKSGLAAPGNRLPGPLGIWAPGKDPLPLPEGYAMPWPRKARMVLQLHLHPIGKAADERSSVGLYFTSEKPKGGLQPLVLMNKNVRIAPGDGDYRLTQSIETRADVDVIGLFPHMHLIGRTVKATATLPDGTRLPLLSIGDWDFNWQGYYQYGKPLHLPRGTRLEAEWSFDNSAANPRNPSSPPRTVVFGEQTVNEMGVLVLDVIAPPGVKLDPKRNKAAAAPLLPGAKPPMNLRPPTVPAAP